MEVIKPLWLSHAAVGAGGKKSGQASTIFTLSLDPEGKRLATGGLDCTIRIWSTEPQSTNRLLAIMSRHTGAVLCVRWSPKIFNNASSSTSYLASSSDDAVVLIWQRVENAFGSAAFEAAAAGVSFEQGKPSESYTVLHRLVGHEMDVNSIEWSADGKMLATCGIDGHVSVWDATAGFVLLRRLETDPVNKPLKGLIWDPFGRYLSAESNDGQLFIWRTGDWKLEACISSPFSDAPIESYAYFSRPSWSPDGKLICLPDAMNEADSVALLVKRDVWSVEESLVGHIGSVSVAKFSPRLYRRKRTRIDGGNNSMPIEITDNNKTITKDNSGDSLNYDADYFLIVALGTQDGLVSIWTSKNGKPLSVINGLFEHAVMDIDWMHDGSALFVSSYDGTVAKLVIGDDLIDGEVIDIVEQQQLLARENGGNNYSNNPFGNGFAAGLALPTSVKQTQIRQETEQELLEQRFLSKTPSNPPPNLPILTDQAVQKVEQEQSVVHGSGVKRREESMIDSPQTQQIAPSPSPPFPSVPSPQITTINSKGKRRITPQLLQVGSTTGETALASRLASSHFEPSTSYSVIIGKSARKSWLKAPTPVRTNQIILIPGLEAIEGCFEIINSSIPKGNANMTTDGQSTLKIVRLAGKDKRILWEQKIANEAITLACSGSDGSLLVAVSSQKLFYFSPAGRRLVPPILLSADICQLLRFTSEDHHDNGIMDGEEKGDDLIVVLLTNGLFYIWKLPQMICILTDELVPHGLGGELVSLELVSRPCQMDNTWENQMIPMNQMKQKSQNLMLQFNFTDNTKLVYSGALKAFFLAEGPATVDPILDTVFGNDNNNTVIDHTNISRILAIDEKELRGKTIYYLEDQIAACRITNDTVRLLAWLKAYAQRLAQDEDHGKASELWKEATTAERIILKAIFINSPSAQIRSLVH